MNAIGFGRGVLWFIVVLLAAAALFFGLQKLRSDPVVLQSYKVSPEIAGEARSALAGGLWRGETIAPLGQVTMMPNGHLLVTAPRSVQRGVAQIIKDIEENKPGPTPTIGFEVWVVAASPGSQAGATGLLTEVRPALDVIDKARGPLNFELLEKLTTLARSGQESEIRGANARLEVEASLRSAGQEPVVAAKVEVQVSGRNGNAALEAHTEMRPGELLVIGQSSLGQPHTSGSNSQIYYIVRATL